MSQIISSPATITQNPRTSYRVYNEEAVIIHHDIKEMIRLNPVASFIWELVKSPLQFDQIVKSVSEIFEVDESVAVDDIKDFIDTYTRYGLLKIDGNEVSEPTRQALDESPSIDNQVNIKTIGQQLGLPVHTILEITEKCNLRCKHCYNQPDVRREELTTAEIYQFLDDLKNSGCLELTITGGEPLLRNDFWDIISYAREKKFSILLKSNGTLIDNDVAKKLYEHCVTEVHVSIYSMDESKHDYMTGLKGSLRSTIKAVEHLKENGITVRISCPVTNLTIGAVKEIKKYADQIGTICGFDLIITKKVNGDIDPVKLRLTDGDITKLFNDEELYDSIFVEDDTSVVMSETIDNAFDPEESICGGGNYLIAVNAYGDVFPCIAWQQKCGNINDHGIKHIWDQSQTLNQIRGYKNKDLGECIRCESLMHCPRCPGVIYHETGSINHKMDMMCLIAENLKIKSSEKLREKI